MSAIMRTLPVGDRQVTIFDGLFDPEAVSNFGGIVCQLPFERRPSFDRELNYVIDNDKFRAAPFLYETLERLHAEHIDATASCTALSHVYAAAIGPGDQTRIHQDQNCPRCVTFLYYANAAWRPEWSGETMFYDDAGDTAACVLPKPGRLAMFPSATFHRAGVPQRDCPMFRYAVSAFYYCEQHR